MGATVSVCLCVPPQCRDITGVGSEEEVDHRLHLNDKQKLQSAAEEGRAVMCDESYVCYILGNRPNNANKGHKNDFPLAKFSHRAQSEYVYKIH